jgi:hypothetical protein
MWVLLCSGPCIGLLYLILRAAPRILRLASHLPSRSFRLPWSVACPLAHLVLGASRHFVDCALDSTSIQKPASVD